MIDRLVDAGIPADRCCRVLGVARQNYYKQKRKPTTPTELRRQWLTGLIREVHVASRGTYGYRRIHAELTLGMGITVCERTVWLLMSQAGVYGLPGPIRRSASRSLAFDRSQRSESSLSSTAEADPPEGVLPAT